MMFWRQTTNNENHHQAKRAVTALLEDQRVPRSARLYFQGHDLANLEKAASLARAGQLDAARKLVERVVS